MRTSDSCVGSGQGWALPGPWGGRVHIVIRTLAVGPPRRPWGCASAHGLPRVLSGREQPAWDSQALTRSV